MAIKINYPNDEGDRRIEFRCIPDNSVFLAKIDEDNLGTFLYFKLGKGLVRAKDLFVVRGDSIVTLYDYEPVDIEITVKPISK